MKKRLLRLLPLVAILFTMTPTVGAFHEGDHWDGPRDDDRGFGRCRVRRGRIVLRMNGREYFGRNTLYLKRMINRLCDDTLPLGRLRLAGVKLVAKSRMGLGYARLRVGPNEGRRHRIGGFSRDYGHRGQFDRVMMRNPSRFGNSRGVWQIKLRGNIRVRKVVILLDHGRGGRRGDGRRGPWHDDDYWSELSSPVESAK